jgi:streptogramin lyase
MSVTSVSVFLASASLVILASQVAAVNDFIDHGVPVPAAEARGVVATPGPDGRPIVIACSMDTSARPWILVTDLQSGHTQQIQLPDGISNAPPYAAVVTANGRFHTAYGPVMVELDPASLQVTYQGTPVAGEEAYLGYTEGPDGTVWAGSYPGTHLVAFDPATRQAVDHGRMDPEQMYMSTLACDDSGWVYCGIGSARCGIVAYQRQTGERRQLIPEAERGVGYGMVYPAADGTAYARVDWRERDVHKWYVLHQGQMTPTTEDRLPRAAPVKAFFWDNVRAWLPDGRTISAYSLEDRLLEITDPATGEVTRVPFDYQTSGADLRAVGAGADGRLYGCSAHPSRFFVFDPTAGRATQMPGYSAWKGIRAFGDWLVGGEYQGGKLFAYDPRRAWKRDGPADQQNPRLAAQFAPDINAPGPAVVHADGRHVILCGQPGYGVAGGGLGIWDAPTGESQVIGHERLVPNQSTVALAALPGGDLVATTSTEEGYGVTAKTTEAVLYVLDWKTKAVTFRTVPVPGATEVRALLRGPDGLVYGVSRPAELFAFDPTARQVVRRQDLRAYGAIAYDGFTAGPDGKLYAVMEKAILRIAPGTMVVEKLAEVPTPATGGVAILKGRLYYIAGSHLWSLGITAP